jgi:phosphoribosyl-AMP cyclohydrolase
MSAPYPIEWPRDGLIPTVIQDATNHDVLMVGFMNDEALELTRSTGFVHFWSRSRQQLWKKGETSGHVQAVRDIYVNCERNSLLIEVDQSGAVCHDGYPTCYYRRLEDDNGFQIVRDRWFDPEDVYDPKGGSRALMTRWWGAYEFLRQHDLEAVSGTSRRLRDATSSLTPRIQDELDELAGVLDGTHVHRDQKADLLLEGSQVCYWIASESVRIGAEFSDVRPDRAMDIPSGESLDPATVATLVRHAASSVDSGPLSAQQAHSLFALVANAAISLGLEPLEVVRRDLEDLRSRDYLSSYFAE